MNFPTWKNEVDMLFSHHFFGLTSEEFEDYLWHDLYDRKYTPQNAFNKWKSENEY